MEYNLLSQINPTRHNWRIKVRITRMWQVSGTSKGKDFSSLELILIDEEGQGITASIGQKDLNKFSKSVVEGHRYYIRNFQVSKQERKFKAIPSTYTNFFTSWTIIEEICAEVSVNLPRYIFNFVDYDDLDHRARHGQGLIDIIGQLTAVHPVVHSSSLNGPSARREVELRDLSDRLLSVTLWGEHATSFLFHLGIYVYAICLSIASSILISCYDFPCFYFHVLDTGAPRCQSNPATKWYINIDIPEVNAFRASLHGRGSEVLLLPGDGDAAAGGVDEENANRKTVSELLSLNPYDSNDVRFTCHASIKEIDVTNGWWYKGCSICKKGLKPTLQGFECTNCNETEPVVVVPRYKLNLVIEDATGRTKIFMFGGVAEQVVRRTAVELVEESSSNQILLPGPFVVISVQTFRTGQLCFQARRVFMPPRIQRGGANVTLKNIPKKDPPATASTGPSSTTPDKEPDDGRSPSLTANSIDPGDESTPLPNSQSPTPEKKSSTKGKEAVSPGTREEQGNVLGKRSRTARKELLYSKKEKASEE
ncbi:hypothetical protein GQ55_7G044000 [Panicum hallii var. hallii]|uniref:Uncharacterized protein n=1 Tax=Panicum hallii var. hallii TaxID=1504633 RepID=A0A2T7CSQ4_9POAL|nr:hypothetical protein GQ55_7G044000 [Panicum hallii var. hallii]